MTVANEQPFILNLHDVEYPKIRKLREKEFDLVAGGNHCRPPTPLHTYLSTPDGDSGDVKCDENPSPNPSTGNSPAWGS